MYNQYTDIKDQIKWHYLTAKNLFKRFQDESLQREWQENWNSISFKHEWKVFKWYFPRYPYYFTFIGILISSYLFNYLANDTQKSYIYPILQEWSDYTYAFLQKWVIYIYYFLQKWASFFFAKFGSVLDFIHIYHEKILVVHSVPVDNSFFWWLKTYVYIILPIFLCYFYYKFDWFQPFYYRQSPKTKFEKYVQLEFTEIHMWFLFLLTMGLINRYTMTYWGSWDLYHLNNYIYHKYGEEYYDEWNKKKQIAIGEEDTRIKWINVIDKSHEYHTYAINKTLYGNIDGTDSNFLEGDVNMWNLSQYGAGCKNFYVHTREHELMYLNPWYNRNMANWFFRPLEQCMTSHLERADIMFHGFFVLDRVGYMKTHWLFSDAILEVEEDLLISKLDFKMHYSNPIAVVLQNQQHFYAITETKPIKAGYYWDLFLPSLKNSVIIDMISYMYQSSFMFHWSEYNWTIIFKDYMTELNLKDAWELYIFFMSGGNDFDMGGEYGDYFGSQNYSSDVFLSNRFATVMSNANHSDKHSLIWDYSFWSFF